MGPPDGYFWNQNGDIPAARRSTAVHKLPKNTCVAGSHITHSSNPGYTSYPRTFFYVDPTEPTQGIMERISDLRGSEMLPDSATCPKRPYTVPKVLVLD